MTRRFDYAAFLRQWRALCAASGIDPLEGASLSSYDRCNVLAHWRIRTHHTRAAAAVYADCQRNPLRTPDDKQDAPAFWEIQEKRAHPEWWDGVIKHKHEPDMPPTPQEQAAPPAPRQERKPTFTPRLVTSAPIAVPMHPMVAHQPVASFEAWLANEDTPSGIARREAWMARNAKPDRSNLIKRRRDETSIVETDTEREVNKRRTGVYHAGVKRYG